MTTETTTETIDFGPYGITLADLLEREWPDEAEEERAKPRLDGLPPRGHGCGDWYIAKAATKVRCWRCEAVHQTHSERVGVCEYLPESDMEPNRLDHTRWRTMGWMAWWQCPKCGLDRFEYVAPAQVAEWGVKGWRHH